MKIPEPQNSVLALIDASHEALHGQPRPHLGCSVVGHSCDRWLWLSFRWAVVEKFPGRILRLFRRGQNEEATIVADLRAIGISVRDQQKRVDFGKHLSGSIDGIGQGVPGGGKGAHLLEFKTHSLKSFNELAKDGVVKSKPMHHVQMQMYMHGLELTRALYVAVCKDDDRIHTERIEYDQATALKYIERGHSITMAERMPPPISENPSWYECKFCPAHSFCHDEYLTKQVNCRTCCHSTPMPDSTWHCAHYDATIPTDAQREGCPEHVIHFDLVPNTWSYDRHAWFTPHGLIEGHTSAEIVANPKACALNVKAEWAAWGAKIVT